VLIEYHQLDRDLEVLDGSVLAVATTKDEIYRTQLTVGRGKTLAIRYYGEWPSDTAVMSCQRGMR